MRKLRNNNIFYPQYSTDTEPLPNQYGNDTVTVIHGGITGSAKERKKEKKKERDSDISERDKSMRKLKSKNIICPPLIEETTEVCQFCKSRLVKVRSSKVVLKLRLPFSLIYVYAVRYSKRHRLLCKECNYYKPLNQSFFQRHIN